MGRLWQLIEQRLCFQKKRGPTPLVMSPALRLCQIPAAGVAADRRSDVRHLYLMTRIDFIPLCRRPLFYSLIRNSSACNHS